MIDPCVSVIVPAYNAELTIARCVDSILGQTYSEIEVIVVNDGSTDRTAQIISSLLSSDSRIRLFNQSNSGVSSARNYGLDVAKGEWVTFVDSDDVLPPAAIDCLVDAVTTSSALIAAGAMSFDYEAEDGLYSEGNAKVYDGRGLITDLASTFEMLFEANYVQSACGKVFSLHLLKREHIRFDEALDSYEDFDFVLKCLTAAGSIAMTDKTCYRYVRKSNETNSTRYKFNAASQMETIANRTVSFYADTLRSGVSSDCICHVVQFFVAAVNNAQKAPASFFEKKKALREIASLDVFAEALMSADRYPNKYSQLICLAASSGLFGVVLALATCRNFIRSMHVA